MAKENYTKPISDVEIFNTVDVVTTSTTGGGYSGNETNVNGEGNIW